MKMQLRLLCGVLATTLGAATFAADDWVMPRTPDGKPDLQGIWSNATQTPLERPAELGTVGFLTLEQKEALEAEWRQVGIDRSQPSDPTRAAPEEGESVGGYNHFWTDRGTDVIEINGEYRTSIIVEPEDGQVPYRETGQAQNLVARLRAMPGVEPYDGPELRPLGERCLMSFGSSSGPPMMPVMYNNNYQIVQTPEYVMIMVEMVHDTRIIRIDDEHDDAHPKWLGDSIGYWDGDTLVVETTGLHPYQSFRGHTDNATITERFDLLNDNKIRYHFTVDDADVYTRPWSGEVAMNRRPQGDRMYEYACHEGNYAFPGILGGARRLERDQAEASAGN
ncbi:MAG: hypothetical protein WD180_11540 [Pseudohongiellaceae bacterium]